MQTVVDFIDNILLHLDDEALHRKTSDEVHQFMQQFPLYPELN